MVENGKEIKLRRSDAIIAYTFLRIVFGVNFFNHGLGRITNIPGFVESQVKLYTETFVPPALIAVPAYLIPPVELTLGYC